MENHDQLQIAASKIQVISSLLQYSKPSDFPNSGNNVYYDLGMLLEKQSHIVSIVAVQIEGKAT